MARSQESSSLTLLQITDTHLHAAADTRLRGVNTQRTLLSVLEHARLDSRWPADAILVTGDIVHDGSRAGYKRFKATLAAFGLPVMCIPGNHDDPKLMQEVLGEAPFAVGGSIRLDSWSFVLLDSTLAGEEGGGLGVQRREGLKAALRTEIGQHVMVCMHHHPIPMGSAYLQSSELRDGPEFLEIIDGYDNVRGVVWGHVHQASDRQRGKVRFLSTPSTGSQFRPNSAVFALDDRPPGLRWLKLDPDGTIDTVVDWVETGGGR
ncbi:metallophosphoesterase [Candidatus Rariloculus sp.]|uniref:metallophosphoesterase n=1 Tax=Candidatus Rariloculus sp. TaxID=3101265 RepID=UPI003D09811F